jgi:DNA-binding Xre family transcriptional regulator
LPVRSEAAKITQEMAEKKKRVAPKKKGKPAPRAMHGIPVRLASALEAWQLKHNEKLSQHDLARKAGVSQPVISKLSNAATLKGVAAASIVRVCEALDCDVAWFLTGVGGQQIPRYRVPEVESTTQDDAVAYLHEPLTAAASRSPTSTERRAKHRVRKRSHVVLGAGEAGDQLPPLVVEHAGHSTYVISAKFRGPSRPHRSDSESG